MLRWKSLLTTEWWNHHCNDDDLAGVVAHEIAHCIAAHLAERSFLNALVVGTGAIVLTWILGWKTTLLMDVVGVENLNKMLSVLPRDGMSMKLI